MFYTTFIFILLMYNFRANTPLVSRLFIFYLLVIIVVIPAYINPLSLYIHLSLYVQVTIICSLPNKMEIPCFLMQIYYSRYRTDSGLFAALNYIFVSFHQFIHSSKRNLVNKPASRHCVMSSHTNFNRNT